jgi:hypothetical protein
MAKSYKVKPEYRTNPMSKKTGGVTVVVEFKDGTSLEYDNIKNPIAYINKVQFDANIVNAYIK